MLHRWGYAPRIETLASQLLGGPVSPEQLGRLLASRDSFALDDGFVSLRGFEDLIPRSRERIQSHGALEAGARDTARAFARDLIRSCPFLGCVALSGSLASGGYGPHDDLDFDLIVDPGTKYTTYLLAQLVGLKYSWRFRHREMEEVHRTPFLPKIICLNVVWPEDQTRPFVRQDENMAFELLRASPLIGVDVFRSVLQDNRWVEDYFPQAYQRIWGEESRDGPNLLGRILSGIRRNPRMLRWLERVSRRTAWVLYRSVQLSRRRNPVAVARMEFLRSVKFPYEVFQD